MALPMYVMTADSAWREGKHLSPQAHSVALKGHKTNFNWKPAEIIWESKRQHSWSAWIGLCPAVPAFPHFEVSEPGGAGTVPEFWFKADDREVLPIFLQKELHNFPFSLWLACCLGSTCAQERWVFVYRLIPFSPPHIGQKAFF